MRITASRRDLDLFHYEMECIVRMFFPGEQVRFFVPGEEDGPAEVQVEDTGASCVVTLTLGEFSQRLEETCGQEDKSRERAIGRLLFRLLSSYTGKSISWGTLTGVRPVKLVRQMREQGMDAQAIVQHLSREYLVAPEKIRLCLETDRNQREILADTGPRDCSLYVSIPFCPSRCSYCSFVSHSVEKSRDLIPQYLEKLWAELALTGEILRDRGLNLHTVYVGGGTPTVLDEAQLTTLMEVLHRHFPLGDCREFTVEAGRPDTITPAKLQIMADAGVDRISINTQSLNDAVLASIGRSHDKAQFFCAFEDAKRYPFTVNVDLIAGLEGESVASFCHSLDQVIALNPGNITVHTLTLKRASHLYQEKSLHLAPGAPVGDMVDYAQRTLGVAGYRPYYLYRQKNTVDSLENVGYAKGGTRCAYNVLIMDEVQTILSTGAGGVTKVVQSPRDIRRSFNYKYPYEYIQRFEEVLARKQGLRALL